MAEEEERSVLKHPQSVECGFVITHKVLLGMFVPGQVEACELMIYTIWASGWHARRVITINNNNNKSN